MPKTILVTGGTGFVGKNLTQMLLKKGCRVIAVSRSARPDLSDNKNLKYVVADTTIPGPWQDELKEVDVAFNLAGAGIFHYWTKSYKELIHQSRILTTRNLVEALPAGRKVTLCNASAVGYYGSREDDVLTENEPIGTDFLANVCKDWENEAFKAAEKDIRVVITRFATVAGKNGGAMKMMIPPYRFFVGGPMGSGRQWFPWIHLNDLLAALWYVIENKDMKGIYNFCAPEPIRNTDLARAIGRILRRPSFLKAPGFLIRLFLGEMGASILGSQRAVPEKLLAQGFQFSYPNFDSAMTEIIKGT